MSINYYDAHRNDARAITYNLRMQVYAQLDINPVDPGTDNEVLKLLPDLHEMDKEINAKLAEVDNIHIDDESVLTVEGIDKIGAAISEYVNSVNNIIVKYSYRDNLFARALRVSEQRRKAFKKNNNIEAMKQAVNPYTLVGDPATFNGSPSVAISPRPDGTSVITPV